MIARRWLAMPWPCKRLALRLGLGLLHHQNFLRLAARVGGDLFALRGVDVVHRRLHLGVGDDVGDQHIDDLDSRKPAMSASSSCLTAAAMPDWLANTSSSVMPGTWPSITCST